MITHIKSDIFGGFDLTVTDELDVDFFLPDGKKTIRLPRYYFEAGFIYKVLETMKKKSSLPFFIGYTGTVSKYRYEIKGVWPVTAVYKHNICLPIKYSIDWDFVKARETINHPIVRLREWLFKRYFQLSDKDFEKYIISNDDKKSLILIKSINKVRKCAL